jgi:hypothetical protein
MSCIYKYKGKDYTKDEFYSLVRTTMVQPRTVQKYEKVLFPTGNTASKVEGHTTLEEFKREKQLRLNSLETQVKGDKEVYEKTKSVNAKERIDKYEIEINQLKQELERVEIEGFGALKPIYNFYENTVTNILNKIYGKVQDYSNTPIKNGVDNLFEENKELSKIGNKQLYSAYLDTIFPDSKVKDIVYHGTNLNFDKFDKTKIGGNTAVKGEKPSFSFSNNKQQAEAYSSEITVGQNTNELAEAWFEENQHVFKMVI